MEKVSTKSKISDIVSLSQLKKKFKQYLIDVDHADFKSSIFPRNLVLTLVMVLEEFLSDSLEYIVKHETNGLYVINSTMVKMVINKTNKYDFVHKHIKKYNNVIKYQDSLFFNIKKVLDTLESKYGSKLMIEAECKNFISYLLVSVQYEFVNMATMMVDYSNRKTLNKEVMVRIIGYIFDKDLSTKIKLKLDSLDTETVEENVEEETEEETVDETVDEPVEEEDEEEDEE